MLTMRQYADRCGLTKQRIHQLILQRSIKGARKVKAPGVRGGFIWMIPAKAKISA